MSTPLEALDLEPDVQSYHIRINQLILEDQEKYYTSARIIQNELL